MFSGFSHLIWCWLHVCYRKPFLCWSTFLHFLFSSGIFIIKRCINWDDHVIFCLYSVLQYLICVCWTILASLEWNQHDHRVL
jgi:hypothetical protein